MTPNEPSWRQVHSQTANNGVEDLIERKFLAIMCLLSPQAQVYTKGL